MKNITFRGDGSISLSPASLRQEGECGGGALTYLKTSFSAAKDQDEELKL